jgi:hypothetical protein
MLNLEEIKARAAAATPGPWECEVWAEETDEGYRAAGAAPAHSVGHDIRERAGAWALAACDAAFIEHARADIPALVAEVERLRARRAKVCECVGVTMGYEQGMTVVAGFFDSYVSARVDCPHCHGAGAVIVEGDA